MLEKYDRYFKNRLLEPTGIPFYPYPYLWPIWLRELVPQGWRSDARYFLLSNVVQMVLAPLEFTDGPGGDPPQGDVRALIQKDVKSIIAETERVRDERDRDYVSATSVAIALGRLAPELATTSLQIWGPRDPQ